jgi:hypothetical protein
MVAFTQILVAGLMTIAVQALPQAAKPSATPTAVATNTPASTNSAAQAIDLARSLLTEPSALLRFKKLLTVDGKLLTGKALTDRTIFDFNKAPAVGKGGRVTAAVSYSPYSLIFRQSLTCNRTFRLSPS